MAEAKLITKPTEVLRLRRVDTLPEASRKQTKEVD